MANSEFFKPAFDALATNGMIGDLNGQPAYAYIRVSSDGQAEEGRSGLPRQLEHIHEIASKRGYRIPWDYVYADDHSGFDFEERPQLNVLREAVRKPTRSANAVVMEHLDRLSRNADWHQGFLLDELKKLGVESVFWKEFGSLVERSVMGAVAQQGMEQEKQRMMEGNLHKARSGRVTARTPAYGYKFVDRDGNEGLSAKKDTYYAVREDEATIVRLCFERLVQGDALRRIASDLDQSGIPPPKKSKYWTATQVRFFITNEVYKGDFYAHRWKHQTVEKPAKNGMGVRKVKNKIERPREEWIHVPVPPIISTEIWEAANHMLEQNKKTSRRNAKVPYLLTGLIRCAHCGWTFTGTTSRKSKGKLRKTPYRGYRCPHYNIRPKHQREHQECGHSQIVCSTLDDIVWKLVCDALLEPHILLDALNADATSQRNQELIGQVHYVEQQIKRKAEEDDKLYNAYMADVFDAAEFALRRKVLQNEQSRLHEERNRLQSQILTPEELNQRKELILQMSQQIKKENLPIDAPFEVKQQIIKLVVDSIDLSVKEGWIRLHGSIRGTYAIAYNLADMGYVRRPARNSLEMSLCL